MCDMRKMTSSRRLPAGRAGPLKDGGGEGTEYSLLSLTLPTPLFTPMTPATWSKNFTVWTDR